MRRSVSLSWGLALLLLGLHASLAWLMRPPGITTSHDDAVYLLLSRDLRQLSYRDVWLIGAPPEAQYPPLYPAVLALTGAGLGKHPDPAVALNVLISTLALAMVFLLVRRWSVFTGLLLLAVTAVNPWLLRLAGQVASEPLFLLLAVLSLWFLARPSASGRTQVAAAALALAATLTRLLGVALLAALFLHWLIERRFRAAAAFAVAGLVVLGPWIAWTAMAPRGLPGQSYLADAFFRGPETPAPQSPGVPPGAKPDSATAPPSVAPSGAANPPPPQTTPSRNPPGFARLLGQRIAHTVREYATVGLSAALALPVLKNTTVDNWLWLAVLVAFGGLGILVLWRLLPAGVLLLACYILVLLVWPYSLERYLGPLVPLVVLTLLLGARRMTAGETGVRGWAIPTTLALVLSGSGLRADLASLAAISHCDRQRPFDSPQCYGAEQRGFFAAAFRGAGETPAGGVFLTPKMATLFYLTGRRSVDELRAASLTPEQLREYLRENGVQSIVLSRVHLDQKWLAERLSWLCREWRLSHEYPGGALLLERRTVGAGVSGPSQTSCEAIDRFARGPW